MNRDSSKPVYSYDKDGGDEIIEGPNGEAIYLPF